MHSSTSSYTFPDPSLIPISPPAPHRRAPRPPTYTPRRSRSRHIRMREPARCGLFTVCEVDESESDEDPFRSLSSGSTYSLSIPSPRGFSEMPYSSPQTHSLDLPRDVDMDDEILVYRARTPDSLSSLNRLSWGTSDSCPAASSDASEAAESDGVMTPCLEEEDPFRYSMVDSPLDLDLQIEPKDCKAITSVFTPPRPRRPPPLDLQRFAHPYRSSVVAESDVPTPCSSSLYHDSLLPSLPILAPAEWDRKRATSSPRPSRKTSKRRQRPASSSEDSINLVSALEELLRSCGEDFSSWSSDEESYDQHISFPLPPARDIPHIPTSLSYDSEPTPLSASFKIHTPVTPPGALPPPIPLSPKASWPRTRPYDQSTKQKIHGDHSFLQSLSAPMASPASSISSKSGRTSSRKNLPGRSSLPAEWVV
jgi:hypothetical protein